MSRIVVRDGTADDRGYAVSTFIASALKEERLLLRNVRASSLRGQHATAADGIKHALASLVDVGRLVVACLEDEPDTLCGWALSAGSALLWVYVAKDFRGHGLAKKLSEKVTA